MVITDAFHYPISIDGCRVFNFAHRHDALGDIHRRLDKTQVDMSQIEIFFMFMGHLDMFRPDNMFADEYETVLDTIHTHNKHAICFVTSVLPMNDHKWIGDKYDECNSALKKMLRERSGCTFYFDFFNLCRSLKIQIMRYRQRNGLDKKGAAHFVEMMTGQLQSIKSLLVTRGLLDAKK